MNCNEEWTLCEIKYFCVSQIMGLKMQSQIKKRVYNSKWTLLTLLALEKELICSFSRAMMDYLHKYSIIITYLHITIEICCQMM